jgi:hypothetical protein
LPVPRLSNGAGQARRDIVLAAGRRNAHPSTFR